MRKVICIFTMLFAPILISSAQAGYVGGKDAEEIFLNGEVLVSGIGQQWHDYSDGGKFVQNAPIAVIKYNNRIFRCHMSLDIDMNRDQSLNGFTLSCWSREGDGIQGLRK